jgi:Mrp family chromosome partitioning ATPase
MSDIYEAVSQRGQEGGGPRVDTQALDPVKLFPPPSASQQNEFNAVAGKLLEIAPAERGGIVCFAACSFGEGASFVSYGVARALGMNLGRRVLWVDANFLAPQAQLQGTPGPSLVDLLARPERVTDLPSQQPIAAVAAGPALSSRRADLTSARFREVSRHLTEAFDYVVVDCPPILEAVETGLLGGMTDGLVVVVESRRLKHQVVNHAITELRGSGVNVLGSVLNKRTFELPGFIYKRL